LEIVLPSAWCKQRRDIINFEEVVVELLEVSEALNVDAVLEEFDYPEEGKGPEDKCAGEGDSGTRLVSGSGL
jgi:hypothetical protein